VERQTEWSLQRHRPRLEMKEHTVVVAATLPNAKIRDRLCTAVGCSAMQQRIQGLSMEIETYIIERII
jgi:hypothetical protein